MELCGDGRCDSPGKHHLTLLDFQTHTINHIQIDMCIHVYVFPTGYSSKYGTYSFQDDATKEIVHYELVQVNYQMILV